MKMQGKLDFDFQCDIFTGRDRCRRREKTGCGLR